MQETKKSNVNTGTNRTTRGAWLAVNGKPILKIKGRDAWVVPSRQARGILHS